ncbi:hypothetical protein J6590_003535 [Homalodisca vitripennis]|nr:hypothetical protein J6590_003535 [Homalodisca vitripennis]
MVAQYSTVPCHILPEDCAIHTVVTPSLISQPQYTADSLNKQVLTPAVGSCRI